MMSQKCLSTNFDSHFWAKMADLLQPDLLLYRRRPQKQTQAPLTNSDIPKGLNIIGVYLEMFQSVFVARMCSERLISQTRTKIFWLTFLRYQNIKTSPGALYLH